MGGIFSSAMDSSMKRQQEFMAENGRIQMERQVQMQNMVREKMIAMQISSQRDLLMFSGTAGVFIMGVCLAAASRGKHAAVVPVVPIAIALAYQVDIAYGNKMKRLIDDSDTLLATRPELFSMPGGPITFNEVEKRRLHQIDDQRFTPNQVFL